MIGLTSPTQQTQPARKRVRPIAVFKPLPWQIAPWRDTSPVILLTGSAGGGKSRLAAEKLHGFCLRYPGTTALALRKTRQSMVNSTVLFLERKIIGRDANVQLYSSKHRFEYANESSILAYGGMADDEQREQVRSIGQDGGVDIIWMEEANQFEENDYNELIARNRAKAGGFRQIILTTNPDTPLHWIYRRLIVGKEATTYYSGESDNFYNPVDYKLALSRMTGIEGQRLREGKWEQATGLVFDTWSDRPDGNVMPDADYIPDGGPTLLAVDDGYTGERDPNTGYFSAESHPRVFLWCQLRNDGRLCVFNESYAAKVLSDQHARDVLAMGYPMPDFAAVDKSAAQLRGLLHEMNIYTKGGPSNVDESIKELREWISPDANGVRRLIVNERCKHLRAEFASYRYDPHNENGDKVVKAFDHGVDAIRYLCWTLRHV